MKKCNCCIVKFFLKILKLIVIANLALFTVFFFDLDGKLLYYVVEPFLKKHYDNMERRDTTLIAYDIDKYPSYEYKV